MTPTYNIEILSRENMATSLEILASEQAMCQYSVPETGNAWGELNRDLVHSPLEEKEGNQLINLIKKETKVERVTKGI